METLVETPRAPGVLYLVATPIGNLEDISARALRVLREARVVAAEDTRVSRKLLAHFDIHTPLTSYHAFTSGAKEDALLHRLLSGDSVALISDAGTPAISDPGAELVAAAAAAGVRVEPIPGACAVIAAVIASGLPPGRFVFEGFLPRPRSDRRARLQELAAETRTIVLYEAPHRLRETLGDLEKTLGSARQACVARELTKKFEEWIRGTLAEISAHFDAIEPRGECVLVLAGRGENEATPDAPAPPDPVAQARDALARGLSPKNAARELMSALRLSRNEAYAVVQEARDGER